MPRAPHTPYAAATSCALAWRLLAWPLRRDYAIIPRLRDHDPDFETVYCVSPWGTDRIRPVTIRTQPGEDEADIQTGLKQTPELVRAYRNSHVLHNHSNTNAPPNIVDIVKAIEHGARSLWAVGPTIAYSLHFNGRISPDLQQLRQHYQSLKTFYDSMPLVGTPKKDFEPDFKLIEFLKLTPVEKRQLLDDIKSNVRQNRLIDRRTRFCTWIERTHGTRYQEKRIKKSGSSS